VGINSCGRSKHSDCSLFWPRLSRGVTFWAKYLTGLVTSVPPYETFSLIKNNILHQSKNYKNHFENSNFLGMWPLGHVGHVTHTFINMLFISTGIFDDKLRPQILSVGTTGNVALRKQLFSEEWNEGENNWYLKAYSRSNLFFLY
jgi:hypothetical protein